MHIPCEGVLIRDLLSHESHRHGTHSVTSPIRFAPQWPHCSVRPPLLVTLTHISAVLRTLPCHGWSPWHSFYAHFNVFTLRLVCFFNEPLAATLERSKHSHPSQRIFDKSSSGHRFHPRRISTNFYVSRIFINLHFLSSLCVDLLPSSATPVFFKSLSIVVFHSD